VRSADLRRLRPSDQLALQGRRDRLDPSRQCCQAIGWPSRFAARIAERPPPDLTVIASDAPPEVAAAHGLEPVMARKLAARPRSKPCCRAWRVPRIAPCSEYPSADSALDWGSHGPRRLRPRGAQSRRVSGHASELEEKKQPFANRLRDFCWDVAAAAAARGGSAPDRFGRALTTWPRTTRSDSASTGWPRLPRQRPRRPTSARTPPDCPADSS